MCNNCIHKAVCSIYRATGCGEEGYVDKVMADALKILEV